MANKRGNPVICMVFHALLQELPGKELFYMSRNEKLSGAANRINRTLQHRLSGLSRFGQSKHEAKAAAKEAYIQEHGNLKGYNPSKVEGIYSIRTMESYRQTAKEFAKWAANKGCKNANKVSRGIVGQYLQERQSNGKSPWTTSKDMAALNKVFGFGLTKAELGLHSRSINSVTRSRNPTENDKRDFAKDKDQITFSKATGCRRQSVTAVHLKDCLRNKDGKIVAVKLTEKGGRERTVPVLNEYKERLTAVVDKHPRLPEKPLFKSYDSHIDNHAFRAEYATSLLHQLENERAAGQALFGGDFDSQSLINLKGRDAESAAPYRGHDRDICAMVSGALGHNRLSVVFEHYIR